MIGIISGALMLTASTLIGLSIKNVYRERLRAFIDAKEFADKYYREIKSLKIKVPEVIIGFIDGKKSVFTEMLRGYLKCIDGGNFYIDDIKKNTKNYKLRGGDNELLSEFLFSLGKNDLEMELTKISNYSSIFEEKISNYSESMKKNGEMYYKLSIVLGLAIWLLLV